MIEAGAIRKIRKKMYIKARKNGMGDIYMKAIKNGVSDIHDLW